jgi:hypothetical protein
MAYVLQEPIVGAQAITDLSTTQRHPLGFIMQATDPVYGSGEFVYCLGVASSVAGDWVTYNADDGTTTRLVGTALIGPVGITMAALIATTYGWVQISGKAIGRANAGFADNANVYATATAGQVDSAVVAGARVKNAKGASAVGTPSAGLAEFEINRPWVDAALAA